MRQKTKALIRHINFLFLFGMNHINVYNRLELVINNNCTLWYACTKSCTFMLLY